MNSDKAEENELESFVASTLIAITNGVSNAQSVVARSAHGTGDYKYSPPKEVAFDIAVNAKRTGGAEGSFKVQILDVGVNAGGRTDSEQSTASRIQFTVANKYKKRKEDE